LIHTKQKNCPSNIYILIAMKTLKSILTLLLVCNFALVAFSQMGMGKYEDIMKIQKRKLIIVTEEPREKVIKKLAKKGKNDQLDKYKSDVVDYNNNMKEIIEQNWPYKENGFEYMSFDQVRELKKTGNRDYAVIYCISQTPSAFQSGCLNANGINWSWNMKYNTDDVDYRAHFTSMVVCDIEGFGVSPVYTTQLPDIFPTKASVIFGVSGVTYYFDYRVKNKNEDVKTSAKKYMDKQVEENAPKLADMNLLIRKDLLDTKVPTTTISKYYPYPFTVCDKETIDSAIVNKLEKTAYVVILPYVVSLNTHNSIMNFQYIFNAQDNQIMAYIQPSMGAMIGAGYGAAEVGNDRINRDSLEIFAKKVKRK
jgi:hypothetical protein